MYSFSHDPSIELLPASAAYQITPSQHQTSFPTPDSMESSEICEGSSTTNENNSGVDSVTSELRVYAPPKPMGTRPSSPSESDISAYCLPPPAHHAFSPDDSTSERVSGVLRSADSNSDRSSMAPNVLSMAPAPTTSLAPVGTIPAQSILPAAASTAIMTPAPVMISSTPVVVQSSSLGTPA